METEVVQERGGGTNCLDCEKYKKLGDVCTVEHGKKNYSDFCSDYEDKFSLPDYNELMRDVRKDMALQRKKAKDKKKRERAKVKRQNRESASKGRRK
jgi:hypothetical protein